MDFNKFVEGLRALGLPNERAVYLAYAVEVGLKSEELKSRIGSFGLEQAQAAVASVEKRA